MNRKHAGFSLVEAIVTLAVLSILMAISLSTFGTTLERAREASTYHLLTTSLATARLGAVMNGVPLTVCPSLDGRSCRGDEVWSDGWIIYRDPDRTPQPQTNAAVLQRFDGVGGGLQLRSTASRKYVRFLPSGWASGSNLSIRLCRPGRGGFLGSVIVNNAGRPRTERQTGLVPCPFTAKAA